MLDKCCNSLPLRWNWSTRISSGDTLTLTLALTLVQTLVQTLAQTLAHRHRETDTGTHRERDTHTESERHRERETRTQRARDSHRHTQTGRQAADLQRCRGRPCSAETTPTNLAASSSQEAVNKTKMPQAQLMEITAAEVSATPQSKEPVKELKVTQTHSERRCGDQKRGELKSSTGSTVSPPTCV